MSEAGWLEREDLTAMLDFLSGKASSRKLRLFACACCRSIWPLLTKKVCRQAIALSEAFADDEIEEKEVDEAKKRLDELFNNAAVESTSGSHREIRKASLRASLMAAMSQAVSNPVWPEGVCAKVLYLAKETGLGGPTEKDCCSLLGDIFGNPFCPVSINSGWLSWHNNTIPKLAQTIYDDRAFDRMPILADALEDAGCTDAQILDHCRQPGEHVRGCWVIDALLGKS